MGLLALVDSLSCVQHLNEKDSPFHVNINQCSIIADSQFVYVLPFIVLQVVERIVTNLLELLPDPP